MEKRLITVSLSTASVTLQPGKQSAEFEVIVRNDSDRQAQFELEVLAPASTRKPSEWYRLFPEVSVAKPPGDETRFQVQVFDTPLLNFVGTVTLTIRVTSPQLSDEARRVLRMTIAPGAATAPASLRLIPAQLQTYPRQVVDISVYVRSLSQHPIEVSLRCMGLTPSWLINGNERRIVVNPGSDEPVLFQCQPPAVTQVPSQAYPFWIEASVQGQAIARSDGEVIVSPVGFVKFAVTPEQQSIPSRKIWLPQWSNQTAIVEASLENLSNVHQMLRLDMQATPQKRCEYEPAIDAVLGLGETTRLPLAIQVKRPWFGWMKTVQLAITPVIKSSPAVEIDPTSQTVQIQLRPLIPLWIVIVLAALLGLLWLLLPRPEPAHVRSVSSVRISRDGNSVVSGSEDCTIRRWLIDHDRLKPEGNLDTIPANACNQSFQRPGVLAAAEHPFRVLAFDPRFNDRVTAGLSNGTIQTWNVATRTQVNDLQETKGDHVFALAFSEDAQTLYSGHAGGAIQVWQRRGEKFQKGRSLKLSPDRYYQVRALALSPDGTSLISAGSRRTLVLWSLTAPDSPPKLIAPVNGSAQSGGDEEYIWDIVFIPKTNQLATADSDGTITFWNLGQCNAVTSSTLSVSCPTQSLPASTAGRKTGIRSIQVSQDGRRIVSGDDAGQVILWSFTAAGNLATPPERRVLDQRQDKINTVDLLETSQGTLVVGGGDDKQVKLYPIR